MDTYELKLFEQTLLTFAIEAQKGSEQKIHILSADPMHRHLLPRDLDISAAGLSDWLGRRAVPCGRAFADEIYESVGSDPGNLKGFVDTCKGLSLNDSYWISRCGDPKTFSSLNLYENRFAEALSLVAWTGRSDRIYGFMTSPEPMSFS